MTARSSPPSDSEGLPRSKPTLVDQVERPIGRPPRGRSPAPRVRIGATVSVDDKTRIELDAKQAGMGLASYLRASLGVEQTAANPHVLKRLDDLTSILRNQGNLLKYIFSHKGVDRFESLHQTGQDISTTLSKIREVLEEL